MAASDSRAPPATGWQVRARTVPPPRISPGVFTHTFQRALQVLNGALAPAPLVLCRPGRLHLDGVDNPTHERSSDATAGAEGIDESSAPMSSAAALRRAESSGYTPASFAAHLKPADDDSHQPPPRADDDSTTCEVQQSVPPLIPAKPSARAWRRSSRANGVVILKDSRATEPPSIAALKLPAQREPTDASTLRAAWTLAPSSLHADRDHSRDDAQTRRFRAAREELRGLYEREASAREELEVRSFSIPSPARSLTPGSLMGERAPQICARQSEPVADTVARLLSSVTAGGAETEPVQEAALTLQEAVEEARRERARLDAAHAPLRRLRGVMSDPRLTTSQGPRATQTQYHFAAAASAVSAAASAPEEKSAAPTASERWRLALLKANNRWCWLRGARPSRLAGQNAATPPIESGLGAALAQLSEVLAVEVVADAAASGLGGLGTLALGDDDGAETSSGVTYMLRLALSATDHNTSNPSSAGPQASESDALPEYAQIVALFAAPTIVDEVPTPGARDARWRVITVRDGARAVVRPTRSNF